jgi:hypothetical protein
VLRRIAQERVPCLLQPVPDASASRAKASQNILTLETPCPADCNSPSPRPFGGLGRVGLGVMFMMVMMVTCPGMRSGSGCWARRCRCRCRRRFRSGRTGGERCGSRLDGRRGRLTGNRRGDWCGSIGWRRYWCGTWDRGLRRGDGGRRRRCRRRSWRCHRALGAPTTEDQQSRYKQRERPEVTIKILPHFRRFTFKSAS